MSSLEKKDLMFIDLEKLKKELRAKNISQEKLAKELGYNSQASISAILNGYTLMKVVDLSIIVNEFGIDLQDIMKEDN